MARISSPKRKPKGSRRLDTTDLRALMQDRRLWVALGLVTKPPDAAAHFEVTENRADVLVHVELAPRRIEMWCRLGALAGGSDLGVWRVPPVGAEVAVVVPEGEVGFQPVLIATLSSGRAPERVSDGRTIIVATDTVEITAPKVILGPTPGSVVAQTDGLVHGTGVDPFTGATYWTLGNTTSKVFSKK